MIARLMNVIERPDPSHSTTPSTALRATANSGQAPSAALRAGFFTRDFTAYLFSRDFVTFFPPMQQLVVRRFS